MSHEYESFRRVVYGDGDDDCGQMLFIPVCEKCGRFVKADATVTGRGDGAIIGHNATCKKCGRTRMLFEGWV